MRWHEVVVHTTTEGADIISDALIGFGATGTEVVDRADILEQKKSSAHWELYDKQMIQNMPEDVLVKGWFEANERMDGLLGDLKSLLSTLRQEEINVGSLLIECSDIADTDWAENWKQFYKPFRVGNRLIIKPTWEEYEPQSHDLVIELDPGMAFGTGTHETTSMCMELIEKYVYAGMRVMDVGTGSGLLAIAAARLGADKVLAIDCDPIAVEVAKENVILNGVKDQVRVVVGDLLPDNGRDYDLIVANIVADTICNMLDKLPGRLASGGVFICSGIIRERERDVMRAAGAVGYAVEERQVKGEWVALCLRQEA